MNIAKNEVLVKIENAVNHERYIEVPRGWNRCLENGSIVYFSPSQICLRSKEDIARYLISDRTCKCGLDCPLYIDKVFNFDATLPSRHFKPTKLENDHKTLCKETVKARFATLAQTQTVIKNEIKEAKVNKPVVIKKKSEVSVAKKKNETPKLPSFETFVSLSDAKPSHDVQDLLSEEPKAKKPRKPALHKKKPNATVTSALPMSKSTVMPTCQTVHTNITPILHSSVEMQEAVNKDAIPKTVHYPTVSTGAVFGTSEHSLHSSNVGPLFAFSSAQLNASSFLAALSSATTIPSRTRTGEVSQVQKVHPLRPFTTTSTVEHAPFGQNPVAFPGAPNQPNNVIYLSSPGSFHNPNSKVNWPVPSGIPLPRLPQSNTDKNSMEKPKGGFVMKGKESSPKMVYPYPSQVSSGKTTLSTTSVTPKVPLKQPDFAQVAHSQQTNIKSIIGEPILPGHPNIPNTDQHSNTRTATKPPETLNQPLQYCGILLQPGMVPQVQLAGTGPRPSIGVSNNQEQNPYSNLYTLQGLPYGGNVGNSAVLGMSPNTVIPYFLGIAQPGNIPKPIVPAATVTSTTKESSPTCATAPVSTSAIAAAYSAFVSIAPASSTSSSFSQQLVNLVSNYNNPYWQHLLTQGATSNTLAYQLMQIGQHTNTRPGLSTQTTKSSSGKSSSHNQTKVTMSSSKSSISTAQESKPKTFTKDSASVSSISSVGTTPSNVTTACDTTVTTAGIAKEEKGSDCITVTVTCTCTSKPSIPCTLSSCTSSDAVLASSNDYFDKKSACTTSETATNDTSVTKRDCFSNETIAATNDANSLDKSSCSETNASVGGNLEEKMDCTSSKTVDSIVDDSIEKPSSTTTVAFIDNISENSISCPSNERVDSTKDISEEKSVCTETHSSKGNKSPERSNDSVASINDNLVCTGSEPPTLSTNHSSDTISEEINPDIETPPSPTSGKGSEKNPGITDIISENSSKEVCKENAMNEDNTDTDPAPSHEVSKDFSTENITTEDNSNLEKPDSTEVTINSDPVSKHESKQEACMLDHNTVTSEPNSLIKKCEKGKAESTNNESLNFATDSEETNKECKNVISDSENVNNDCTTAASKYADVPDNNDSATNERETDENVVLDEKKESNCNVKTDSLQHVDDVKTDSFKDTDLKTGLHEKKDEKMNSLEDSVHGEIPMETEETLDRLPSKQDCDQDVKVKSKEDTVKAVGSKAKNGEAESVSKDTESTKELRNKEKVFEAPVEFTIGDIVWAQARGLPSWPGKIVDERDVGHGKAPADSGKKWVMWFGDHTFSQVEVEKLKTLTDGLKTLDDKGRKRKYRGKKTRIGLEQAISEALEELDKRERLRSRQGPKSKKRRL